MLDFLNAMVMLSNFVLIPAIAYGAQLALGLIVQADHGKGGELEAERRLVEKHGVAGDETRLLEGTHAPEARRRG